MAPLGVMERGSLPAPEHGGRAAGGLCPLRSIKVTSSLATCGSWERVEGGEQRGSGSGDTCSAEGLWQGVSFSLTSVFSSDFSDPWARLVLTGLCLFSGGRAYLRCGVYERTIGARVGLGGVGLRLHLGFCHLPPVPGPPSVCGE